MSLFPAYCNEINKQTKDLTESSKDLGWLENSSYQAISSYLSSSLKNEISEESSDEDAIVISTEQNEDESISKNKHYKVKNKKSEKSSTKALEIKKNIKVSKRKAFINQYETCVKDIYFEDKDQNKIFSTLETLEFTMRPIYKLCNKQLGFTLKKGSEHLRHFKRYHVINLDTPKKSTNKKNNIISKSSKKKNLDAIDETKTSKLEDEQKEKTEEFNKKLTECPKDIHTWLEYVDFQDSIQLSSHFCLPENIKQIINKKKLSIVERGLMENHSSVELLELKLQLMSKLLPVDEFVNKIEAMIEQDVCNIILRQTLITVIQTSCVLCKVPLVLNVYVKFLSVLKQKSKVDSKYYDKQILQLLYQCLTFLRHVGFWEQMWEILKINLCLNLDLEDEMLKNINTIDENILMSMEDLILNSKLPLNQLWLRIELLRERCHWISVDINKVNIDLIGDEKRLVSAEETNEFIYPTISMQSNFQLIILTLLCLKVPLLPSRHCTLKDFKGENILWTIDSLEFILPMIYSTISIGSVDRCLSDEFMITSLLEREITSGPQYLKFHPAQESYLDFIRLVFSTVAEKLPITQRTSILIWWLRFERLLVFFTKRDSLQEQNRNKKVKLLIKNFLKKTDNRNNLHFYREFALFEYELDCFDSCVQMLKRIIESQNIKLLNNEEKETLFSLYRTTFEILLDLRTYKDSNKQIFEEIVESLHNYTCVCFNYNHNIAIEEILFTEILKFLTNSVTDETEDTFMLPNVYCDILICYAYLIFNKNNESDVNEILELFNRCLQHCNNCFRLQERFYETKVVFLKFCQSKNQEYENIFTQTVNEAVEKFPNNLFLQSITALIDSKLPCWKLKTSNKRLNIWSILANCLAGRARIIYLNSISFEDAANAMINKMLSFYKTVSKTDDVQSCPLVWRFYMLLLQEYDLCKKKGEEIYYEAVNLCPWVKSVYMGAAEIAPQLLSQIQDLIKEKELRMHVTPEELDILRE